jgi:signal transduction histidine kinase
MAEAGAQVAFPTVSLPRRFAWAAAARLILLTILLVVILAVNVRGKLSLETESVQIASVTLLVAFGLSGLYAWFLREAKHLHLLVNVQLVLDQAIWTVMVYLSGGATSGATSFYGISCLFGAVLSGFRGAALAAASAAVCYLGLIAALATGLLSPPADQPSSHSGGSTEEIVYGSVVVLLMLVVVALLAGNLTERLRATGGQLIRAEARADQAEREAALGRLAAGLAHEIRNPLGSIAGSIRILATNPSLDDEDRQLCEIVDREARRLDDLVTDMLELSKPRRPQRVIVDLALVAREVVELSSLTGRGVQDVTIEFDGPAELRVSADGAMLRQMLWNLVRNAVQASTPGEVVRVVVDEKDGTASVRVEDNGLGIEDVAKDKLFDISFTTRSQGAGIGLAVVKRIVDDHGWRIDVQDTAGGGATFAVTLGAPAQSPLGPPSLPPKPKRWTLFPRTD